MGIGVPKVQKEEILLSPSFILKKERGLILGTTVPCYDRLSHSIASSKRFRNHFGDGKTPRAFKAP
jgi:hypothetical protein